MSNNNADEIAAFMNELEESRPAKSGGRRGATYDILKPEFGQIYRNYAIVSFNHGTSPLGADSVVVRMVNMDTGRREKIYLQSYEIQDWERFVRNNEVVTEETTEDGVKKTYNLPVLCDFLKQKEESQKNPGRFYKSFNAIARGPVDRDTLPDYHEDQAPPAEDAVATE
ncbi:MAG: hypothetical protein ACTSPB_21385 [Candidatus Thorarchaeota archaeon]|jgi:hypothetical protein